MKALAILLLAAAGPALAQSDEPNAAMPAMDMKQMDMSGHDHGGMSMPSGDDMPMDMSGHDHAAMTLTVNAPPPASAGSGPPRAADAIWGADAMRASRAGLGPSMGGAKLFWFMAERAEYRRSHGEDGYAWNVNAFYGGDIDKLWFKSEGEGTFDGGAERAEVQALWSHAIGPWFDLQTGVRQDLTGAKRTNLAVGVRGTTRYLAELDAAAFVSTRGDVTARIEAAVDQRITQRFILQPRGEIDLAAQDIAADGIGAGLDRAELGLRLRYEFSREIAPYLGVEQEWKAGGSADFAHAKGERAASTRLVAGLRLWF